METTTEIIVKEADIDGLEHVNHSVYVRYFETARSHWYRSAGFSFEEMRQFNVAIVVLKISVLYKREARLGDVLTIKTVPLRLGNTSFDFKQVIYNEQGEVVTESTNTSVMFDRVKRKGVPVVEQIARHFPSKN